MSMLSITQPSKSILLILTLILALHACQSDHAHNTQGKIATSVSKAPEEKSQSKRGKVTINEEPTAPEIPTLLGHYPAYAKNANLYEVNLSNYTPEGTFAAFIEHLPRLKNMGVDVLIFLPIYNNSNLINVNPELGTIADFRLLVRAIHKARMKIVMSFADLQFLDLDNQQKRKEVMDAMKYWTNSQDIDGYYITDADQISESFWSEVHTALINTKQDILMLAGSQVQSLKEKNYFHADTGDELYSLLLDIATRKKRPKDIVNWQSQNRRGKNKGFQIQYTSKSDVNNSKGPTNKTMGPAHNALAALSYTLGDIPMMYGGQEEPVTRKIGLDKGTPIGFDKYLMEDWYQIIFKTKHMNQALWNGDFGGEVEWMQVDDQILSYKREKNGQVAYCIFNLSNTPATFQSEIEVKRLMDVFNLRVVDLYQGTKILLEPWTYKVYSNI